MGKNTYNKGYENECRTGKNRVCEVEHINNRASDSYEETREE